MNRITWTSTLALATLLAPAAMLRAQNPFEFGGAPAAPATPPPATAQTNPFGDGTTGDLIIDTLRESNPTTPVELLRAVQVLRDYGAKDEALVYLKQLVAAKPDNQTLAALSEEFGEVLLMRLIVDPKMQPEGRQFALSALAAYRAHVRNPARLSELIQALKSDSLPRRSSAIAELRKAHDAAVDQMMIVLNDPNRSAEHKRVREAMLRIQPPALAMSLAALRTDNPTLKQNAILIIGHLGDRRAAAYLVEPYLNESNPPEVRQSAAAALRNLLGNLPSAGAAVEFLDQTAREFERGALVAVSDEADFVPHWQWSDNPPGFTTTKLRSDDASLATAADLTGALYRLSSDRVEARRRYLLAELKRAKIVGGYNQPITATQPQTVGRLKSLGVHVFDDVLDVALSENNIPAAAAAAEMLGEIGDPSLLHAPDGYPRPLAKALSHGDSRVRFAAASAIAKIAPTVSYAGASRFAEAAAYFIRTEDQRSAVVCEPREARTHTVAGLLSQNGIEGIATYTGKRAWEMAARSPDVEMVFLSWAIDRPNLNETLQMFRTDKRTKRLPIAIMTDDAHALNLSHRAAFDPLTIVVPYPHTAESLAFDTTRLLDLLDRDYVGPDERVRHALAALGWFEAVAVDPDNQPDYDLMRHRDALERAMFVPALADSVAPVLAALATPNAQQALVDFASQSGRSLEQRKAAAAAFGRAVDRRGVQLTREAILRQYDRYNDSAALPVETQELLGSLLDTIERPSRASAAPADMPSEELPPPDNPTPASST